ncbi:hypothetical protein BGX33_012490, partial [Mortierella sp. NVP41]
YCSYIQTTFNQATRSTSTQTEPIYGTDNREVLAELSEIVMEKNDIMRDLKHAERMSTGCSSDSQDFGNCSDDESDNDNDWEEARNEDKHWQEVDISDQGSDDDLDGFALARHPDRLPSRIVDKLYKQRTRCLTERMIEVYIPLQAKASLQEPDDKLFPLKDKVQEFLLSPRKVLLLLGDSGGGKSTFLRELEHDLWRKYSVGRRIPLRITLAEIDKPEVDMIEKHLRSLDYSPSQISDLKKHSRFTLLCDGYDETKSRKNLYASNKLNRGQDDWDVKMIITCRSTYLGQDYRGRFQPLPADNYSPVLQNLFQEAVIAPFSRSHIQMYIDEYVSLKSPAWKVKDYMTKLDEVPGLMELVRNPFHLWLALDALPGLVGNGRVMYKIRVSRLDLFDTFVDRSIEVAKTRLQTKRMNAKELAAYNGFLDDGFKPSVLHHLKCLAIAIFKEQGGNPVVSFSDQKDKSSWKVKFFGSDVRTTLLRDASPLTREGSQYQFLHSSLLDYFYCQAVFDPEIPDDDESSALFQHLSFEPPQSSFVNSILSERSLGEQPSILEFLAERVQQDVRFKNRLHAMVEASKTYKYAIQAAANAITILVRAEVPFNGADLRKIKIHGADLSGGYFDSANLQGADLTGVNLLSTWLRQANLNRTRLGGVQFGEKPYLEECAVVLSCVYSPNGETLALSLDTGRINIYDTTHWNKSSRFFSCGDAPVRSIAFSPKGSQLVSASDDETVRIWDFESGDTLHALKGHVGKVSDAAFSPCGRNVASVGHDRMVRLWDTKSGEAGHVLKGHTWPVTCVAYSPNGRLIASGSEDMTVRIWSSLSGVCTFTLGDNNKEISSVVFSPVADQMAYGCEDGTVHVYDIKTTFSPDSISTCSPRSTLRGHSSRVSGLAYSPCGRQIASASWGGTIRIWNAHNSVPGGTLYSYSHKIHAVAFSRNGLQIASAGDDKTIRLWSTKGVSRLSSNSHRQSVSYVTYSSDGALVASASQDGTVRIWDAQRGQWMRTFQVQCPIISPSSHSAHASVALSHCSGTYSAYVKSGRMIQVSKTATGVAVITLTGHTDDILCLSFSPDRQLLASGSLDRTVRLWNYRSGATGDARHVLGDRSDGVTALAFSRQGQQIAIGTRDGRVELWTVYPLVHRHTVAAHTDRITSLVYSACDRHLLSTSLDRTIKAIETNRGVVERTFSGHSEGVISVVYLSDDKKIASIGDDDTIRLWDVRSGLCLSMIGRLVGPINTVDWKVNSPAEVLFVTGCEDKSVRQWRLDPNVESGYRSPTVQLVWSSNCDRLVVSETRFQGSVDLSTVNRQLLKQRGIES